MSRAYHRMAVLATGLLAVASLVQGAAPAPDSARGMLAVARAAYEAKAYGQAQGLAEKLLERYPDSGVATEGWLLLIDALASQDKYMAGFEQCEKLLKAQPGTRSRSEVLRREFELGKSLCQSRGSVLVFSYSRLQDGVRVLERVVEHSPFGPLADDAVFAIAEAQRQQGNYEDARDQYEHLLKNYSRSDLARRAMIGRAACNYHLTQGAPYDPTPAEEAAKDFDILARAAGGAKEVTERRDALHDVIARGSYDAGIFYFRNGNVEAGMRYLASVIAKYPRTKYADRARRILKEVAAKYPQTEYAVRARTALAMERPGAGKNKEKP